jgi:hypothetical protein
MAKKPLNALDEQAMAVSALFSSIADLIALSDKTFPEKLAKKVEVLGREFQGARMQHALDICNLLLTALRHAKP